MYILLKIKFHKYIIRISVISRYSDIFILFHFPKVTIMMKHMHINFDRFIQRHMEIKNKMGERFQRIIVMFICQVKIYNRQINTCLNYLVSNIDTQWGNYKFPVD